jgi:cytochrome bd-type quinol oxidase subunit 2
MRLKEISLFGVTSSIYHSELVSTHLTHSQMWIIMESTNSTRFNAARNISNSADNVHFLILAIIAIVIWSNGSYHIEVSVGNVVMVALVVVVIVVTLLVIILRL